jgi:TRAP-type C4-dicarboxylate transport system permease small subunit
MASDAKTQKQTQLKSTGVVGFTIWWIKDVFTNRLGEKGLKVIAVCACVGVALTLAWQIWLGAYYVVSRPKRPQPALGRIYEFNQHENFVYLTKSEWHRVDIRWFMLQAVFFGVFMAASHRASTLRERRDREMLFVETIKSPNEPTAKHR